MSKKLKIIYSLAIIISLLAITMSFLTTSPIGAKNRDIIGRIKQKGTKINYPIVKGKNNTFYINHSASKKKNVKGAIFMDCHTSFSGKNCVIYGHDMADRSMFGSLNKYTSKKYAMKHKIFKIYRNKKWYKYKVISSFRASLKSKFAYKIAFNNKAEYKSWYKKIIKKSKFKYKTKVKGDKVITLCTCCDRGSKRMLVYLSR